jgi:hypothetical protein
MKLMQLKCFDHACKLADRCALHIRGDPGPGEEWMSSLFPYDIPITADCPHFVEVHHGRNYRRRETQDIQKG